MRWIAWWGWGRVRRSPPPPPSPYQRWSVVRGDATHSSPSGSQNTQNRPFCPAVVPLSVSCRGSSHNPSTPHCTSRHAIVIVVVVVIAIASFVSQSINQSTKPLLSSPICLTHSTVHGVPGSSFRASVGGRAFVHRRRKNKRERKQALGDGDGNTPISPPKPTPTTAQRHAQNGTEQD